MGCKTYFSLHIKKNALNIKRYVYCDYRAYWIILKYALSHVSLETLGGFIQKKLSFSSKIVN